PVGLAGAAPPPVPLARARPAPSEWPGTAAETSAANPADSAAAPAITHRRVRDTRCSAASRSSCASDWLRRSDAVRDEGIMLGNPSTTASHFSKASVRIRLLCPRQLDREGRTIDLDPAAVTLDDRRDD